MAWFQLPEGQTGLSVDGVEYTPDEERRVEVPDEVAQTLIAAGMTQTAPPELPSAEEMSAETETEAPAPEESAEE